MHGLFNKKEVIRLADRARSPWNRIALIAPATLLACAVQASAASASITAEGIAPEATIRVSDRIEFSWFTNSSLNPSLQFAQSPDPAAFIPGEGRGPGGYSQYLDEFDSVELKMKFLTAGDWYWRMCETLWVGTPNCTAPIHFKVAPITQCEDSIDNDHDGGVDRDDLACKTNASLSERLKRIPVLRLSHAKRYAKEVMSNSTRFGYDAAANTPRWRCSRVKKLVAKCKGVWAVGDGGYVARVRIFYRWCRGNAVCWHYSYRVTLYDEYCLSTGGSNCIRRYKNR